MLLTDDTALLGFSPHPSCQWWGPNNWFLVEEHSQGLVSLTDPTACDTVPEGDAQIILDAYIKNISWSDGRLARAAYYDRELKAKEDLSRESRECRRHSPPFETTTDLRSFSSLLHPKSTRVPAARSRDAPWRALLLMKVLPHESVYLFTYQDPQIRIFLLLDHSKTHQ